MYVANCSLKYNPEDFTVVDRVLTLASNTELVGDAFIAHHCGGLLLDGGVFAEKKVDGKYVVCLVDETPTSYIKAKCSLFVDGDAFEIVDGALSLKAVEPSGFDIRWDGNTEGLESTYSMYRVTDDVHDITSPNDLIGTHVTTIENGEESTFVLTEDDIASVDDDGKILSLSGSGTPIGLVVIEDTTMGSEVVKRGFWLGCITDEYYSFYISRLYKE